MREEFTADTSLSWVKERLYDPSVCDDCLGQGVVSVYYGNVGGATGCRTCGGTGRAE